MIHCLYLWLSLPRQTLIPYQATLWTLTSPTRRSDGNLLLRGSPWLNQRILIASKGLAEAASWPWSSFLWLRVLRLRMPACLTLLKCFSLEHGPSDSIYFTGLLWKLSQMNFQCISGIFQFYKVMGMRWIKWGLNWGICKISLKKWYRRG